MEQPRSINERQLTTGVRKSALTVEQQKMQMVFVVFTSVGYKL